MVGKTCAAALRLLDQRMVGRELFGRPDSQLMTHRFLRNIGLWQRYDDLVMHQQPVDVLDLLVRRVSGLELDDATFFTVSHTKPNRLFE